MKISFSKRSSEIEIMDDLQCEGAVVNQTLRELDFINQWLGGNAVTIDAVEKVVGKKSGVLRVADVGCGSGEMLRLLAKRWPQWHLYGFDANPNIIQYAKSQPTTVANLYFYSEDIWSESFQKRNFDIVLATLFLHHFSSEELVTFLRQLKQQSKHVVINDIHRHPLAYYSIKWLTKLFSKSSMVQYDAPLSVLRSFSKNDWLEILQHADIKKFQLRWKWAFRWQIIISN